MSFEWKKALKSLGPGFITGASDDDPSGIATYTQIGAQFGFGMLWTAFWCIPFMVAVQEMVGRIGLVTGEGLVASLRRHYPKWLLWTFVSLIFVANTINLGTDLGAMADATRLLVPGIPFPLLLIGYTVLILVLEIFLTYKTYAKILKWFAMSLLSYLFTMLLVTTNWREVFTNAFFPTLALNKEFILAIVAILGTTISPYLFIWQSNEEVEEEIARGRTTLRSRKGATPQELAEMRSDTFAGMTASQSITFCIIATAASAFFLNGYHDIQSSAQAAAVLEPLAGHFSSLLFTLGVVGTGLLAIPVLSASASYAIAEALNWKNGLYKKLHQAHGFYGAITISTVIGLGINFVGINPIKALVWTAVINGIVTAPLLFVILHIANNKKIMKKQTNGRLSNFFGISICVLMSIATLLLFILQ